MAEVRLVFQTCNECNKEKVKVHYCFSCAKLFCINCFDFHFAKEVCIDLTKGDLRGENNGNDDTA